MAGHRLDASTVALWRLNETSGSNCADAAPGARDLTATGATITDGLFGKCRLYRHGQSDKCERAATDDALGAVFASAEFSWESWIYRPTSADGTLFEFGSAGTTQFRVKVANAASGHSGAFAVDSRGHAGGGWTRYGPTVPTNAWVHLAVTFEASTDNKADVRLTIDCAGGTTVNVDYWRIDSYPPAPAGPHYLKVGEDFRSSTLDGLIDDTRISDVHRGDICADMDECYLPSPEVISYLNRMHGGVR